MFIKQISIFAENRNGAIMEITGELEKSGVNIRALSIADTSEFGVVRLIVDKTEEAVKALREYGLTVVETDVIALSVDDTPGSFHKALEALYKGAVMIEYAYAFVSPIRGGATVILRCREQETAVRVLTDCGIQMLTQDDVNY